jgi:hypothetical protein
MVRFVIGWMVFLERRVDVGRNSTIFVMECGMALPESPRPLNRSATGWIGVTSRWISD